LAGPWRPDVITVHPPHRGTFLRRREWPDVNGVADTDDAIFSSDERTDEGALVIGLLR
jgi:hypothetical protein